MQVSRSRSQVSKYVKEDPCLTCSTDGGHAYYRHSSACMQDVTLERSHEAGVVKSAHAGGKVHDDDPWWARVCMELKADNARPSPLNAPSKAAQRSCQHL
eukprot:scaffold199_cov19-Tisochrysis_lutea.AAC.2